MSTPSPQLDYAPVPPDQRRRAINRRVWLVLILGFIAWVGWSARTTLQRKVDQGLLLFRQSRSLRYTIDADRVVYEENTDAQDTLLKQPDYCQFHRAKESDRVTAWDPKVWDPLWTSWPDGTVAPGPRALIFLHERSNDDGEKLLLAVHARVVIGNDPLLGPTEQLVFEMHEMMPGDWTRNISPGSGLTTQVVPLDYRNRSQTLRMYGGQVDPNDPKHFTIRYQLGGVDGVIDGWEGTRREGANGIPFPGLRLEVREAR